MARSANAKAAEACEDFKPLEDSEREAARDYLIAASRNNFLLEVFRSVNTTAGDDLVQDTLLEVACTACCVE